MKKTTLLATALATTFGIQAEMPQLHFTLLKNGNYGEGTVTATPGNGFKMTLKNTEKRNHAIALANFKLNAAAQQKLVFRLRGKKSNGNAFVSVTLLYGQGKEWKSTKSPSVQVRNDEFKTYIFGLDTDFKLGDGSYLFRQLKFVLNSDRNPRNSTAEIDVQDVRIVHADEISGAGTDFTIVPYPVPEKQPLSRMEKPIRVWFEFDNDDRSTKVQSRVSHGAFQDPVPAWSFRHLLLEHADGLIHDAESPESADVIVYSRAGKGGQAETIARKAKAGIPLIVYGVPADPEIAALLPVKLSAVAYQGLPERRKLTIRKKDHPLLQNLKLTTAAPAVYHRAEQKNGAAVLLTFDDGNPFLTEQGNILHFNTGIGGKLDASDSVFYDRFLLHAIARDSKPHTAALAVREQAVRKQAAETERKRVTAAAKTAGLSSGEAGNWRLGASADNVGRFGWLIGEPLLADSVGKDLSVSNDAQRYSFATDGTAAIPFSGWSRKAIEGSIVFPNTRHVNADPCESWSGVGTVQYETSLLMENGWKGKTLVFEVKDGIDDTDEFLFNGHPAGKTGEDTPYHWMVPRRYRIPADRIRWGKENRFTLRVRNLRGNAKINSRPVLHISDGGVKEELSVSRIDWTGKSYQLKGKNGVREMALSLLTPFIRYRFPQKTLFLNLENIAEFAAYQSADGIRVVPLNGGVFYEKAVNGAWSAPWLLLFRPENSRPLLLVFSAQPEKLSVRKRNGIVEGIGIRCGKAIGELAAGWPWGVREMQCRKWTEQLPATAQKQIRQSLNFALNFPVACEEIFSINRAKRQIEIINVFRFERTRDDWNTPVRDYAFLPALSGFMAQEKRIVSPAEPLTDFGIPTYHGPLVGVFGKAAIRYSLPLPPDDDLMPVGVRHKEINAAQDYNFAGGVRWSCGGRVSVNAWTPAKPAGVRSPLQNIDPFAWNFGICSALQGAFFLNDSNRKLLEERTRRRFMEPLELYQYKNFARHREEPFSRLHYPILFNSFYPNSAAYSGEMGSTVIYGDSNEACTVAVWIGRQLADGFGQADMVRLNWNYFRYAMRYQNYIDDYVFQSGSCRETGVGAWIDMLNGEYSGMLAYARLAELNGDTAEMEQALYRAAKKAVPTIARLCFHKYFETIRPEFSGKTDYQITGFGEDGAKIMRFPNSNGNFFAANDLFDYSQGFPGQLIQLYQRYGLDEVKNHLRLRAAPLLLRQPKGIRSDYIPVMAVFAAEEFPLAEQTGKCIANHPRTSDWPGIRVPVQLGMVLWNMEHRISFRNWRELNIRSAWYDPAERSLTLSAVAGPDSLLVLSAEKSPVKATGNGKSITLQKQENGWKIPLSEGENRIRIRF